VPRTLPDLGIDPAAIRSILFVELTRMGDVISAFTAVNSLRNHFPHARVCHDVLRPV